jgi:hypothetical protein
MRVWAPTAHAARRAGVAAAIGFGAIAGFRLALAAGAPLGQAASGGADAHLTTAQQLASALAVAVCAAAARVVLAHGTCGGQGG